MNSESILAGNFNVYIKMGSSKYDQKDNKIFTFSSFSYLPYFEFLW